MNVNSRIEDKKLEEAIEMLRKENPVVYVNLKKLVVDIIKKYLSQNAEDAFVNRHFYDYDCYRVDEKIRKEFLGYCGMEINSANTYLLVKKTDNFAMIFCSNGKYVVSMRPVYEKAELEDILCVFGGNLFLCAAEEAV